MSGKPNVVRTGGMVEDKSLAQGKMERKGVMTGGSTKSGGKPKKASAKGKMVDGPYGSKSKA